MFRHLGETAFPSKDQIDSILNALSGTSTDGMTLDDLQERCNLRRGQIENALKFLAAEAVPPIRRVGYMSRATDHTDVHNVIKTD